MALCDFLGRARALKAIYSWNISPKHVLAINRHILASHFGHLASLVWAELIQGHFRDAVAVGNWEVGGPHPENRSL